jgi:hypothetical protein
MEIQCHLKILNKIHGVLILAVLRIKRFNNNKRVINKYIYQEMVKVKYHYMSM